MRYLFFDIECANCFQGKGKICSFGYVITNTKFDVLEKYDIVINPASKFNLGPDIVLAYDKATFKNAPLFTRYFPEILTLLEDEDTMVFGFSASNDAKYLNDECIRYDLPSIDYTLYDVQQILMGMKETRNQPSLIGSCLEFGVNENQDVHKSDDDSLMTMELLRAICEKTGKSPEELVDEYKNCKGVIENYKFEWVAPIPKPVKEKTVQSSVSNRMNKTSDNYNKFVAYMKTLKPAKGDDAFLKGKRVCLTAYYEQKHYRQMKIIAKLINDAGGKYVFKPALADVFVEKKIYRANGEERPCPRLNSALKMAEKGKIEIISFEDFLEKFSFDEETLNGMADAELLEAEIEKVKTAV